MEQVEYIADWSKRLATAEAVVGRVVGAIGDEAHYSLVGQVLVAMAVADLETAVLNVQHEVASL